MVAHHSEAGQRHDEDRLAKVPIVRTFNGKRKRSLSAFVSGLGTCFILDLLRPSMLSQGTILLASYLSIYLLVLFYLPAVLVSQPHEKISPILKGFYIKGCLH